MPDVIIHRRGEGRNLEVTLENAAIDYRNFQGRPGQYNKEGDRNFALMLPEDFVDEARREGWNVKRKRSYDDQPGGEKTGPPYVAIHVGFKIKPPRMVMITETSRKRTILDEDICENIDYANVSYVDVTIRPRPYDVNGRRGIKIWLDTIYVIIQENYLDLKYADWDSPREITSGPADPSYIWEAEVIADDVEDDDPLAIESGR